MSAIIVEKPTPERLNELGVKQWPTWSKEISIFPWQYSSTEIAYILEGEVTVTPKGGAPVSFSAGDLVTFSSGLDCVWEVKKPLRKHYHFE
ncbi:cupin domain-containing protein [Methylophilus methylotrophus]|uniref:cupin domain-containing protein n=1 Tax=Methylophilus methylotrophus TaxID=17 RepID=UPI0003785A18|nr:cupin domain-containing protein [Methylophilus methylotrophus]